MNMSPAELFLQAVSEAPTKKELAEYLGIAPQTLSSMISKAQHDSGWDVPARHVLALASVLGVRPHAISPELYPSISWSVQRHRWGQKSKRTPK